MEVAKAGAGRCYSNLRLNLTSQGYFSARLVDNAGISIVQKSSDSMEGILSLLVMDRQADDRNAISRQAMQAAISVAVKKADPDCKPFIGVIVQRTIPKSSLETNWAIRGIKFGRADRNKAKEAVDTIVQRLQREFILNNENPLLMSADDEC